jgi:hypothetical protein
MSKYIRQVAIFYCALSVTTLGISPVQAYTRSMPGSVCKSVGFPFSNPPSSTGENAFSNGFYRCPVVSDGLFRGANIVSSYVDFVVNTGSAQPIYLNVYGRLCRQRWDANQVFCGATSVVLGYQSEAAMDFGLSYLDVPDTNYSESWDYFYIQIAFSGSNQSIPVATTMKANILGYFVSGTGPFDYLLNQSPNRDFTLGINQ